MEKRRQNNNYLIGWGWVRVGSSDKGGYIISKYRYLVRVDLSNEKTKEEGTNFI